MANTTRRDQYNNDGSGLQINNINYNNIVSTYRAPQFVSSLGPVPVFNAVEDPVILRDDVFEGIDAAFQSGQHRYVLHGPKGVGKTTAAYQYAELWLQAGRSWMSESSEEHHVRWFLAVSGAQVLSEYRSFAQDCFGDAQKFGGRPLPEIRPTVDDFLKKTPNVLLVFDSVEDSCIVEDVVGSLLSMGTGVYVLVTTVHAAMSPNLNPSCRVMLDAFTEQQVHQYLRKAWPGWSVDEISKLQQSPLFQQFVNRHPKRLNWLSAVVRNNPIISMEGLLSDLRNAAQTDPVFTAVVDALFAYHQHQQLILRNAMSIVTAVRLINHAIRCQKTDPVFTIVVDALITDCKRTNSCGWRLLRNAARLASAPIPVELLRRAMHISDTDLSAGIKSLQTFSLCTLVQVCDKGTSFHCLSLHSLARGEVAIYDATYHPFGSGNRTAVMETSLLSTMLSFGSTDSCVTRTQQMFLPHIQHLLASPNCLPDSSTVILVLEQASSFMRSICAYREALTYSLQLLEIRRKTLVDPHVEIASSLANIANRYSDVGDHVQALQYSLEALEMRRKVLPDPHPDIASSLVSIGCHYCARDDAAALNYTLEGLKMRRKLFPDPHADVASSMSNIGVLCSYLGDHALALEFAVVALEMRRKVLPDLHPDIASSMNNIGNRSLGDRVQGLKYALEALEKRRPAVQDPHAEIALSMNNIGSRYGSVGDCVVVLKSATEALEEVRCVVLPDSHADIASSLNNIGSRNCSVGNHVRALKSSLEAVAMKHHPDIASSLANIGCHNSFLGKNAEAVAYGVVALEMRRKVLPYPHPDIASSLNNIANSYRVLGMHAEALTHAEEALVVRCMVLPDPHPDIASSLNNVGNHLSDLGERALALRYTLAGLQMRRKVLPNPHPQLASSVDNVGICCGELGLHAVAVEYAQTALKMRRKVLPDPHADIASSLSSVGNSYRLLGDHREALKHTLKALDMRRNVLPDPHPLTALSWHNVGVCYGEIGCGVEALNYALGGLTMRRRVFPYPHPDIASSLNNIANSYKVLGMHADALKYCLDECEMRGKLLQDALPYDGSLLQQSSASHHGFARATSSQSLKFAPEAAAASATGSPH